MRSRRLAVETIIAALFTGLVGFFIAKYTTARQRRNAFDLEHYKTVYEKRIAILGSVLPQLEDLIRQLNSADIDYHQWNEAIAGISHQLQQLVEVNRLTTAEELQSARYLQQLWMERQEVISAGQVVWQGDWNRIQEIDVQFLQVLQALKIWLEQQLLQ
jgi:hypothetical protein